MIESIQSSLEVIEHTRWVYTVRFKLPDGKTILFSARNVPVMQIDPNIIDVTVVHYTTEQQYEVTVDTNPMLVYREYKNATAYIEELINGGNNLQAQG